MENKRNYKIYQHKMAAEHKHKWLWVNKELDKKIMEDHEIDGKIKKLSVSSTYEKLLNLGLEAQKCLQAGDFYSFQQLAS